MQTDVALKRYADFMIKTRKKIAQFLSYMIYSKKVSFLGVKVDNIGADRH